MVEDYQEQHPELTTLKTIVNAKPDGGGDADGDGGLVRPFADGYPLNVISANGQRQTEMLMPARPAAGSRPTSSGGTPWTLHEPVDTSF